MRRTLPSVCGVTPRFAARIALLIASIVVGSNGVILIWRGSGVEIVAMFLMGIFEPHASTCTPSTIAGEALPVRSPANWAFRASKLLLIFVVVSFSTSETVSMFAFLTSYFSLLLDVLVFKISDRKFQISNLKFQISDFKS